MISFGGGLLLVAGAVYLLFFSERTWLKIICGAYIAVVLLSSIEAVFRSGEPMKMLIVPGLIVILVLFAFSVRRKWKDWP
jgi:O-antigen/teichoic acid export membrane protein